MLDTSSAASNKQRIQSVPAGATDGNAERKAFIALQARFALRGRQLNLVRRAFDGRVSYVVTFRGESRHLGHLHDVKAHLSAVGGTR